MTSLHISVDHTLSIPEAQARIKKLISSVKLKYGKHVSNVREDWEKSTGTFSFAVMSYDVSGTIKINKNTVELHGTLPWSAALFKGKIESVIKEQAEQLLQK